MNTKPAKLELRDWFAGLAMQRLCAGPGGSMLADNDDFYNGRNWKECVASNAYEFADAMIAARETAVNAPPSHETT